MPLVIFLTAYDQHAIEAFTLHALDYLLKPVSDLRFHASLQRAREQLHKRDDSTHQQQLTQLLQQLSGRAHNGPDERIMIRTTGHVYFLKPAEITWGGSGRRLRHIHTPGKTHLVRETLKHMEAKADPRRVSSASTAAAW